MVKPRNRLRKTERGSFSNDIMNEAVDKVIDEGLAERYVANLYQLAHRTLNRYVQKRKAGVSRDLMHTQYGAHSRIFNDAQEADLNDYITTRAKMAYGLTRLDVRRAAYQIALANNIPMPKTWIDNEMAGEEWLKQFRGRHPQLTLRKPEGCSLSRATSFNKHNVDAFYDNLFEIFTKFPELGNGLRVYNLDETGLSTVQTPHKVLANSSMRQLNKVTSAERGTLVTACCIVSAAGNTVPPVLVFPRMKFKAHMLNGAPPGTQWLGNKTGWMTSELFEDVIAHFIKHTNSSADNPTLLVLDNHESHLAVKAIHLAKNNGVQMVTLPPHCSNKLQPLDLTVYKSLKSAYNAAADSWLCNHPGSTISIYQVAELFGIAFQRSMTPSNICSGFRSSGIYPYDRNIFTEDDFLISSVTDRPNPLPSSVEKSNISSSSNESQNVSSSIIDKPNPLPKSVEKSNTSSSSNESQNVSLPSSSYKKAETCLGIPKAGARKRTQGRKRGKSKIVTNTPEMKAIEEKHKATEEKNMKKKTKCAKKLKFGTNSKNRSKTKIISPSVTDESGVDDPAPLSHVAASDYVDDSFSPNDFCIVKFITDQDEIEYYVGQISKIENDDYSMTFLRKKSESTFYFPNTPDIATVKKINIYCKLELLRTRNRNSPFYSFTSIPLLDNLF